jgi:hypothetical protein
MPLTDALSGDSPGIHYDFGQTAPLIAFAERVPHCSMNVSYSSVSSFDSNRSIATTTVRSSAAAKP